jgi:hypothetical protein
LVCSLAASPSLLAAGSGSTSSEDGFAVTIRGVHDGDTVAGNVHLYAEVSSSSVERVDFFIDGRLRWSEKHAPYVLNGDTGVWSTRTEENRFHHIAVRAVANDGSVALATADVNIINGAKTFFARKPALTRDGRVRVEFRSRRGAEVSYAVKSPTGRILGRRTVRFRHALTVTGLRVHGWRGERPLSVRATVRTGDSVRRLASNVGIRGALFLHRPDILRGRRVGLRATVLPRSDVRIAVRSRTGDVLGSKRTAAPRSGIVVTHLRMPQWNGHRQLRFVLVADAKEHGGTIEARSVRRVKLTRAELKNLPPADSSPPATEPPAPEPPSGDPPPTEPPPSEQPPIVDPPSGDVVQYKIGSTACERPVPLVGGFLRYTAAPGEITVGEHGERCETFYGDSTLTDVGKRSLYGFAVWLPPDFQPIEGNSDWFYISQAHKLCPCGGFGGPNVGVAINGAGQFRVIVRAYDGVQVYAKTLGSASTGRVHTFLLDAFWSPTETGRLRVEWNGTQVVDYQGPTLFNDDSGGVKLQGGIYRRATDYDQTVFLTALRRGSADALRAWLASVDSGPNG